MKTKLQKISYWAGVAVIGIIVGISLQFAKAWAEPQLAAPNSNVGAPINTGATSQTKTASIVAKNGNSAYYASLGWGDTVTPSWTVVTNGNVYAKDYYIEAANKWASQLGGVKVNYGYRAGCADGSLPVARYWITGSCSNYGNACGLYQGWSGAPPQCESCVNWEKCHQCSSNDWYHAVCL